MFAYVHRRESDVEREKLLVELFEEVGHDIATVSEQNLGGASNDELTSICQAEGRVLVTLDLDFSNVLRFPPQQYAGTAVLRVPHPIELETIRQRVRVLLKASESENLSGRLWIVERDRIREYSPK